MGSIFRFKEFEVDQGNCAMKINTDGVLLGSSTYFPEARRILDVGTGTGVIALMLAQRHPEAQVDAVEIEEEAYKQASLNFRNSDFSARLNTFYGSFADMQPTDCYDIIVSNPPFYTNSVHNPDVRKRLAKHSDIFFFEKLLAFVSRYLADRGKFSLILPTALADLEIATLLPTYGLYVQEEIAVSSFLEEIPIRKLWVIGKEKRSLKSSSFSIYERKGVYTSHYRKLVKPYFLAF